MTAELQPTPQRPPSSEHLVVYLDTSASMAGYVSTDGRHEYGLALRALRDIATSFKQPLQISVRAVDVSVKDPDPDGALALQKASVNPSIYRGGDTDLAGAFSYFSPQLAQQAAQSGSEAVAGGGAAADAPGGNSPPPARFSILITDGIQSTKAQNTKQRCLKGSDATCVREKIIALLKQGWGGYVIALRSQFHGKIYSEVGGGSIQYDTTEGAWKRYRPFYLYVFSPDRVALDEFIDVLRERLRQTAPDPEALRVLALTSPYATEAAKAEVIIPDESADVIEFSGPQQENPARFTLEVDSDRDETEPAPFAVAITVPWSSFVRDSAPQQELNKLLRWEVVGQWPAADGGDDAGRRRAVVRLKGNTGEPAIDPQGRVVVQTTVGWPRSTAKPSWIVYKLQSKLDLGMGREPLPWIKAWSTDLDTTTEFGNRTLNLESVLTGLWRNPVLEEQVVTTVYLRVGPQ